jgi:hypothetical protein
VAAAVAVAVVVAVAVAVAVAVVVAVAVAVAVAVTVVVAVVVVVALAMALALAFFGGGGAGGGIGVFGFGGGGDSCGGGGGGGGGSDKVGGEVLVKVLAGKVGCPRVKTKVKMTDMHLSGRRVADMLANMSATQHNKLSTGTGPTCHSMSLSDMSATCRQHDEYLAVGFEPMSMLLLLDSPATLPVRTCVLNCRVAGISSNMSAA